MQQNNESPLRAVIIHGHFYQPPRDNPWLGFIERQASAHPFHDWTERINDECYRANAFSPIQADGELIECMVNNFTYLSFNIGPTLFHWLDRHAPDVYRRIIEADRLSRERCGGHGNAIAQAHNHTILPLANHRDKKTQILWGLEDFQRRFHRRAEGMWLPETAIDEETVSVLIDCGLRFVILAPSQLEALRPLDGSSDWSVVTEPDHVIHPRPYRIFTKGARGGHLDAFFFDRGLSTAISFENLLRDGNAFARRLEGSFQTDDPESQAVVVATDGETFGHHHWFGNMCLSYFFNARDQSKTFEITNFAHYLDRVPPRLEARLQRGPGGEGTSWSCAHGVGRWYRDCGCSTGGQPGWNQKWRSPLRLVFDLIRDKADELMNREGPGLMIRPWDARDEYPVLLHDRSPETLEAFLDRHALPEVSARAGLKQRLFSLLELHYYCQLMYTSCGWFFADIAGLEPVQDLLYAAKALEILRDHFDCPLEREALELLGGAVSNVSGAGHGKRIFRKMVLPRVVPGETLAASYLFLEALGVKLLHAGTGENIFERIDPVEHQHEWGILETGMCRLSHAGSPIAGCHLYLFLCNGPDCVKVSVIPTTAENAQAGLAALRAQIAGQTPAGLGAAIEWTIDQERQLPPFFRRQLAKHTLTEFSDAIGRAMESRLLSIRDCRAHPGDGPPQWPELLIHASGMAIPGMTRDRIRRALLETDPSALREARRLLKTIELLDFPLPTEALEKEAVHVLAEEIDRNRRQPTDRGVMRLGLMIKRAKRLRVRPAGKRELQVRFWTLLEQVAVMPAGKQETPPVLNSFEVLTRIAGDLGYHMPSVKRLLEGAADPGQARVSLWRRHASEEG